MNVASLELCKELYELSGWDIPEEQAYWSNTVAASAPPHYEIWPKKYAHDDIPAYDLGFLIRALTLGMKLTITLDVLHEQLESDLYVITLEHRYRPGAHHTYSDEAYSPEDALCKLAIQLFKQNILTKESES